MAILPFGISTLHFSPALALYAARDDEVLPVDAQITFLYPNSTAFETPTVIPLSLNDPVGFCPSNFTYNDFIPRSFARFLHSIRFVFPSESDTMFSSSQSGMRSKYFQTPARPFRPIFPGAVLLISSK